MVFMDFPMFSHISLSIALSRSSGENTHTYIYIIIYIYSYIYIYTHSLHRLPFIDYVHDFSYITTLKPEIYRQTYRRSVPPESACASNAWLQGVHLVQIIHAMGICHEIYPMVNYIYIWKTHAFVRNMIKWWVFWFMLVYRKVNWFSCTIY